MNNKDLSAFPVIAPEHGPIMIGLTKREYFAAMAMQGLLAGRQIDFEINHDWQREIAKEAVEYADSLLNQLES